RQRIAPLVELGRETRNLRALPMRVVPIGSPVGRFCQACRQDGRCQVHPARSERQAVTTIGSSENVDSFCSLYHRLRRIVDQRRRGAIEGSANPNCCGCPRASAFEEARIFKELDVEHFEGCRNRLRSCAPFGLSKVDSCAIQSRLELAFLLPRFRNSLAKTNGGNAGAGRIIKEETRLSGLL